MSDEWRLVFRRRAKLGIEPWAFKVCVCVCVHAGEGDVIKTVVWGDRCRVRLRLELFWWHAWSDFVKMPIVQSNYIRICIYIFFFIWRSWFLTMRSDQIWWEGQNSLQPPHHHRCWSWWRLCDAGETSFLQTWYKETCVQPLCSRPSDRKIGDYVGEENKTKSTNQKSDFIMRFIRGVD